MDIWKYVKANYMGVAIWTLRKTKYARRDSENGRRAEEETGAICGDIAPSACAGENPSEESLCTAI